MNGLTGTLPQRHEVTKGCQQDDGLITDLDAGPHSGPYQSTPPHQATMLLALIQGDDSQPAYQLTDRTRTSCQHDELVNRLRNDHRPDEVRQVTDESSLHQGLHRDDVRGASSSVDCTHRGGEERLVTVDDTRHCLMHRQ